MAISAPTFVQPLAADHTRDAKIVVAEFTFDSSYPTGGEAIDLKAQLGLSDIYFVTFTQKAPVTTSVYQFQYDRVNAKILVFSGGTEVADTTSLATVVVKAFVYGLSS